MGTFKILLVLCGVVALGGLIAALDDPTRWNSWATMGVGVLLAVYLLTEWRRLSRQDQDE